ncbi:MAG TPA: response regulator [Candidatus Acidoferrum sp.]|nr:response regulator [Candidatus Acidoferrum sp.]
MKPRILVVEDNAANRELLCDWLEAEGFEAVAAENLEQGFAALKSEAVQAVLLDIQLGQEDGLILAKWIREESKTRDLPVFAVTAHAMMTDHERMMRAGCNACISKPIHFKVLRGQLRLWLREESRKTPAVTGCE